MPDSWPAKSPDDKLAALLPLARRIALSIARRCPRAVNDDILAAAAVGAWETVRRHGELDREDIHRYAVTRIKGAILDELRRHDWLPRRARLSGLEMHRVPLVDDRDRTRKLDHGDHSKRGGYVISTPETQEDGIDAADRSRAVYEALAALPERERDILVALFVDDHPAADVARRLRLSQPRISQLKKRALRRLREAMG